MRQADRNWNLPKKSSLPFDPSLLTKSSSDIKPAEIFVLQHILGLENNCQNIITKYIQCRVFVVVWLCPEFLSCPKKILRCVRTSWFEQWKEITIQWSIEMTLTLQVNRWQWCCKFSPVWRSWFHEKNVRLCFHVCNPISLIYYFIFIIVKL